MNLSPNEKQLSVRTNSARRSKVSELGFFDRTLIKKSI